MSKLKKAEIKQINEKLLDTKEQLVSDMEQILKEVKGISANRNVLDEGDEANHMNTRFRNSVILDKQSQELKKVEYALLKINKKNFGVCEMCSESIRFERLLAKPYAKYCIDCKNAIEQNL
ncbi:MAG: Unknown protein [uncultured Campylobacterales bacterium]|uniref:Zinc finger DksA/TraR C4-type domain-containing protein n=1 Tax=uncultured Campylobacterales bacterium TaxID=352960 RepID=A0A6S6S5H8_9BACT|nr:MAG: Unknown protein [uncultured Campylobacterales bacterium]